MKIINEKENKLFNRKEIQINVESEVTPSHEETKKLISEKFSTKPENIRIKKISGKFGSKDFEISANIYSSEGEKNKIEIFSKKEAEQEKKPESKQPVEEKPEEVPVEQSENKENSSLKEEQEVSNEIAKEEASEEIKEEEKK